MDRECQLLAQELDFLLQERKRLRQQEQNQCSEMTTLSRLAQVKNNPGNLRTNLSRILPPFMMPGNVGEENGMAWMFFETVEFDFGANPILNSATFAQNSFQVTAEASFLMLSLSVAADDFSFAGLGGPYQVTIRDNQSSRQFNDLPIPIQNLSHNSCPRLFPTPLLFNPNASVNLELSTWLQAGDGNIATNGSGHLEFMIGGLRLRNEDADKVLSNIFQR